MNDHLRHLLIVLATAMVTLPALTGCGGEDEGCRSDHDCESDRADREQVCEPDGCKPVCTEDADCAANEECVSRRVEEGMVCGG